LCGSGVVRWEVLLRTRLLEVRGRNPGFLPSSISSSNFPLPSFEIYRCFCCTLIRKTPLQLGVMLAGDHQNVGPPSFQILYHRSPEMCRVSTSKAARSETSSNCLPFSEFRIERRRVVNCNALLKYRCLGGRRDVVFFASCHTHALLAPVPSRWLKRNLTLHFRLSKCAVPLVENEQVRRGIAGTKISVSHLVVVGVTASWHTFRQCSRSRNFHAHVGRMYRRLCCDTACAGSANSARPELTWYIHDLQNPFAPGLGILRQIEIQIGCDKESRGHRDVIVR